MKVIDIVLPPSFKVQDGEVFLNQLVWFWTGKVWVGLLVTPSLGCKILETPNLYRVSQPPNLHSFGGEPHEAKFFDWKDYL